jgi:pimeloyl-ACP methyl ester carboxylesterase
VHLFYLHGFASSPMSSKAQFFGERLAERRLKLHTPDFNQPDFSTLTISRMLQQLEKRIAATPPGPVVLIGSSLGGFVAIETAARQVNQARHPIARVVLLAPAVELEWERWTEIVAHGGVDAWRTKGDIEVFHYADEQPHRLKFGFYTDAQRYKASTRRLTVPTLVFQGRRDESVTPAVVEKFAKSQPDATLHLLDDSHQLKESLDFIWRATSQFLSLPEPA